MTPYGLTYYHVLIYMTRETCIWSFLSCTEFVYAGCWYLNKVVTVTILGVLHTPINRGTFFVNLHF